MYRKKEKDRKPHLEVAAAIIRKEGKVLVAKRPRGSHMEGYWEFPGGKKERGEGLEACLKREVLEELNLCIEVEKASYSRWYRPFVSSTGSIVMPNFPN